MYFPPTLSTTKPTTGFHTAVGWAPHSYLFKRKRLFWGAPETARAGGVSDQEYEHRQFKRRSLEVLGLSGNAAAANLKIKISFTHRCWRWGVLACWGRVWSGPRGGGLGYAPEPQPMPCPRAACRARCCPADRQRDWLAAHATRPESSPEPSGEEREGMARGAGRRHGGGLVSN